MDSREYANDYEESIRAALDGRQTRIWTSLPGIVQSFDAIAQTCVVQPSIQGRVAKPDGSVQPINLPLLLDCPVLFPSGGGVTLTFPIKKGDECLVWFASRGMDFWWQLGGIQPPAEARMHDLSDGFVMVGPRSQPRVLANISTTHAQLRSDDGVAFVDLDPTGHVVKVTAPGGIVLDGPVHITGVTTADQDINVTGTVTASTDVIGGGKHLKTHIHSGVTAGTANTGAPT
ncbi:MAG: hypothetical protein JWQ97_299 [Phenylobacterium sp.]|nr:hypothetical protein [Phenylobacterium sp.]